MENIASLNTQNESGLKKEETRFIYEQIVKLFIAIVFTTGFMLDMHLGSTTGNVTIFIGCALSAGLILGGITGFVYLMLYYYTSIFDIVDKIKKVRRADSFCTFVLAYLGLPLGAVIIAARYMFDIGASEIVINITELTQYLVLIYIPVYVFFMLLYLVGYSFKNKNTSFNEKIEKYFSRFLKD